MLPTSKSLTSPVTMLAPPPVLSPSISERIKRLEENGVIAKFTLELNPELIGYPFSAIVRIKPLPGKIHILQQRLINGPITSYLASPTS